MIHRHSMFGKCPVTIFQCELKASISNYTIHTMHKLLHFQSLTNLLPKNNSNAPNNLTLTITKLKNEVTQLGQHS